MILRLFAILAICDNVISYYFHEKQNNYIKNVKYFAP